MSKRLRYIGIVAIMTFVLAVGINALRVEPAFAWTNTLTVVKHVSGGTAVAGDFMIHVKHNGVEVSGSPKVAKASGVSFSLEAGTYVVTETGGPAGYTATFAGICSSGGALTIVLDQSHTCTITNTSSASSATPTPTPTGTATATPTPVATVSATNTKITICHATGSATNPYVEISVDTTA